MTNGSVLRDWLGAHPRRPALTIAGETLRFGDLRPADPSAAPLITAAGNGRLALLAYGAALAGRTFLPLDPALPEAQRQALGGLIGPGGTASLVVATSGSTGRAKAVMLSAGNIRAHVLASKARLPLAPDDVWLDCLPLFHVGGLMILWRCAEAGARVLLHERFDLAALAADLPRATHISLVPTMLARLLEAGIPPGPRLRVCLVGGAALPGTLAERALAAGWPLYATYGMSETASQAATLPLRPGWRPGTVGTPLDGFDVALKDGRIALRGPAVMLGYANPAMRPGDGLADGWFVTSDLGAWDAAGALVVLGRADDMLISGGENVQPLAVEEVLARCPGVAAVGITARRDAEWGDRLVAVVVGSVDDGALLDWARAHLPPPQRPREIVRMPALPLNASGKLDRSALRRLIGE